MTYKRSTLYWAFLFFVVALIIRLVFLFPVRYDQPRKDPWDYDHIAWNLAQGKGYSLDGNSPTAYRAPAFPTLLATVYALLGRDWFAARVITATLSALTVSVIFLTGLRLFNFRVGMIAATMAVFYPKFIDIATKVHADNLFNLLLALSTLMLIMVSERQARLKAKLMAGVCLGLAGLARPEPFLLFPFLIIWAFWISNFNLPDTTRLLVPILLPGILFVSLWAFRNYRALDAFIPTTTGGGVVVRGVYNEVTFTDDNRMGRWIGSRELPDWQELKELSEVERDRTRYQLAFASIRSNWRRLPKLEIYKLHNFVFGNTPGMVVLRFPIVFFAIIGLVFSWRISKEKFSVIYMLLFFYLLRALVFFASERYRAGVEPYIFILAVLGISEFLRVLTHYKAELAAGSAVIE